MVRLNSKQDVFSSDKRGPRRKICGLFNMPTTTDRSSFTEIINGLPEEEDVLLYGLPANVNRAHQITSSQLVISKLQSIVQFRLNSGRQQHKFSKNEFYDVDPEHLAEFNCGDRHRYTYHTNCA